MVTFQSSSSPESPFVLILIQDAHPNLFWLPPCPSFLFEWLCCVSPVSTFWSTLLSLLWRTDVFKVPVKDPDRMWRFWTSVILAYDSDTYHFPHLLDKNVFPNLTPSLVFYKLYFLGLILVWFWSCAIAHTGSNAWPSCLNLRAMRTTGGAAPSVWKLPLVLLTLLDLIPSSFLSDHTYAAAKEQGHQLHSPSINHRLLSALSWISTSSSQWIKNSLL